MSSPRATMKLLSLFILKNCGKWSMPMHLMDVKWPSGERKCNYSPKHSWNGTSKAVIVKVNCRLRAGVCTQKHPNSGSIGRSRTGLGCRHMGRLAESSRLCYPNSCPSSSVLVPAWRSPQFFETMKILQDSEGYFSFMALNL